MKLEQEPGAIASRNDDGAAGAAGAGSEAEVSHARREAGAARGRPARLAAVALGATAVVALLLVGAGTAQASGGVVLSCVDSNPPDDGDGNPTGGGSTSSDGGGWSDTWSDAGDAIDNLWNWLFGGGDDGPDDGGTVGGDTGGTTGDGGDTGGTTDTGGDGGDTGGTTDGSGDVGGTTVDNGGTGGGADPGGSDPGGSGGGGSGSGSSSSSSGVMGSGEPRTAAGRLPRTCTELAEAVSLLAPRRVVVKGLALVLSLSTPATASAHVTAIHVAEPLTLPPSAGPLLGLHGHIVLVPGHYRAVAGVLRLPFTRAP